MDDNTNNQHAVPVTNKVINEPTPESILVIDSGVGGLSVCQSILAQQPCLQIIYFADSAYFPYGLLPEAELSDRLKYIVGEMLKRHQPQLVVLACNTVSTLMLPILRALYDIPFVGVVPAIKPAALMSKSKRIGLLATPATISRAYTDQLIHDYAQGCEVVRVGSSELVVEAESLLDGRGVNKQNIECIVKPFQRASQLGSVDAVVLGCTHFPLLKEYLVSVLPNVSWIDSGEAVANRVTHLLAQHQLEKKDAVLAVDMVCEAKHQLYFSKAMDHKEAFSKSLQDMGFKSFEFHTF